MRDVIHLDLTTSTNDAARAWAQEGAPDGAVVVAEGQTAGRGRRGRAWHSPPGVNIYLSRILRGPFATPTLIPLVGALAARETVQGVLPPPLLAAIKWPNDVLVGDYKVAGILCELLEDVALVGIGLNVNMTADDFLGDLRRPASSLRLLCGYPQDRRPLLDSLLDRLDRWRELLDSAPQQLLDEFSRRCLTLGRLVTVSTPGRESFSARACRLDRHGALVVEDESGRAHRLEAGDVDWVNGGLI